MLEKRITYWLERQQPSLAGGHGGEDKENEIQGEQRASAQAQSPEAA